MVGAHKNINDSRDLTTPLSGMVCHPGLALATTNQVSHYEDMKDDFKMSKMGCIG